MTSESAACLISNLERVFAGSFVGNLGSDALLTYFCLSRRVDNVSRFQTVRVISLTIWQKNTGKSGCQTLSKKLAHCLNGCWVAQMQGRLPMRHNAISSDEFEDLQRKVACAEAWADPINFDQMLNRVFFL